jgi:hypothetical protein
MMVTSSSREVFGARGDFLEVLSLRVPGGSFPDLLRAYTEVRQEVVGWCLACGTIGDSQDRRLEMPAA